MPSKVHRFFLDQSEGRFFSGKNVFKSYKMIYLYTKTEMVKLEGKKKRKKG